MNRLNVTITSICNRFMESAVISKKFPNFLADIDSIEKRAFKQAIGGLLEVYKFQHLIQIIRWLGQSHNNFDVVAFDSASNALAERMTQEADLKDEMNADENL